MVIVLLRPFTAPLSSGLVRFLPGLVLQSEHYSESDWNRILDASGGGAVGYLNSPAGSIIDTAATECVALRARGGDVENQTQGIMQTAVIRQWD